jgi:type I restriction-modification system DNA methylase subunit
MPIDISRVREHLENYRFQDLFIEELGWDRHRAAPLTSEIDGVSYTLQVLAEKRGLVAFICSPDSQGCVPLYTIRRQIEKQVAKIAHEHLIIFVDSRQTEQVWQWVKRELGRPTACREYSYNKHNTGELIIQKLRDLVFELEEEENLTLIQVAGKVKKAFDVEKVTKRFYDLFKKEHDAFLKFIRGIPDAEMQRWYASVMLNRLMFIYFIQKKGFLDNDQDYLRHKLQQSQQQGEDRYYRDFLCPLFFEGFAQKPEERSAAVNQKLGQVPYLNGGIFTQHYLEALSGLAILIPDAAFDNIFTFFEAYQWHLDERPLRADNEINPDVLGYIFEKYINQKQMGAYYTKEDITEYISKNTIIPFLFDAAEKKCAIAFRPESALWRLLADDPDRYIYDAVKHGVTLDLPDEIAVGIQDVAQRTQWNKTASPEYALPTEIWREVVARRQRYQEIWNKLINGEVYSINDLITYNLNIRQLATDVIENCEGPELLRAFYHAIEKITVLDPTCGSGAFLFAALNILEPLYEACLQRMEVFVAEMERSETKHHPKKFADFKEILARIEGHPNRRYFILKSIMVNNLYGVDIMPEAIEICKLRLFLKLVAQVEQVENIEPLPDIDFNIRAGNTLVGFVRTAQVKQAISQETSGQGRLVFGEAEDAFQKILVKATDIDQYFESFRRAQLLNNGTVPAEHKQELTWRLAELSTSLDVLLAREYGISPQTILKKKMYESRFAAWRASHQPFHWFSEFYGIIQRGGFDVIIGNPPYVEVSNVKGNYTFSGLELIKTGNLYSICLERFAQLSAERRYLGIIVPISSVSTPRMLPLMQKLASNFSPLFVSNFAVRPGKLFVGTDMNLTIFVGQKKYKDNEEIIFTTNYIRWREEFRPYLFNNLAYVESFFNKELSAILKINFNIETTIISKLFLCKSLNQYRGRSFDSRTIFYHSGGRYFRKCLFDKLSNEYKELKIMAGQEYPLICLLSSSLYYWYWLIISDCYHVTSRDIDFIPIVESIFEDDNFKRLGEKLLTDMWNNAVRRIRNRSDGSKQVEVNFYVGKSKQFIDDIDKLLAKHYGFTDEELDFIINYDIKYRMGAEVEE